MEEKDEIHINVNGEDKIFSKREDGSYKEKTGNYYTEENQTKSSKLNAVMRRFPYAALCVLAYLACGFIWKIWHPTWIIFLTIPLFYSLVNGNGFVKSFPYPIFIAITYLAIGFVWNLWHPGWILFLTIPLYYTLVNCNSRSALLKSIYPLVCAATYLVMGFAWDLWHPGWLIFLTIPIFDGFVAMAKAASVK